MCVLFCVRQSHKTINTKTKNALKKNNIVDKIPNTLFQTGTGKVKKKKKHQQIHKPHWASQIFP